MPSAPQPRQLLLAVGTLLGSLLVLGAVFLRPPGLSVLDPSPTDCPTSVTATRLPSPPPKPSATAVTPAPVPTAAATPTVAPTAPAPFAPDGVARQATVPILMYHYVGGLPADADVYRVDLTVPPERFEEQLAYLQSAGYTGISLEALVRHLAMGTPLPPKPIVLTFDDGYEDNYLYAFPLLRRYGFAGTFFVITGFVDEGRGGYLTWDQAKTMQENGMDIEPHTVSHEELTTLSADALAQQLVGSRQAVEDHLQKPGCLLSYPGGDYDDRVIEAARQAGYWGAVTTEPGAEHSSEALFTLDRVRIHGQETLAEFQALLAYYE